MLEYMICNPKKLDPNAANVVSILCFSDTHEKHYVFDPFSLPSCDIVVHGGDFSMTGSRKAVKSFNQWGKLLLSIPKKSDQQSDVCV